MKRIFGIAAILGLLLLAGDLITKRPHAIKMIATVHAGQSVSCSLAAVAGNYGFTINGSLILPTGPVPIAAIGRATVDAEGNASGTEARNVGGNFANETLTGTVTVEPDCTGTETLKFFESGQLVRTIVLSAVIDDNSNEVRFVQQSLTLPDGTNIPVVVTGLARKINPNSGE
jgi:hypothetical protein